MKRIVIPVCLCAGLAMLTSCGVAEGLAKAVGRTSNSVSRSVSNLGGALSR